ncbi:hypothetical protein BU16DRAFT_229384 [Lophium mytilinum]|uniref:Uncharacterized protein n=1 Tax=Lophium mytilinum TaxID=390894 RepID=A0A6A6Q9I7_9PEZI|nr:hypothetical protein BU16DRAFT_229384 [Lophium mytilinum]
MPERGPIRPTSCSISYVKPPKAVEARPPYARPRVTRYRSVTPDARYTVPKPPKHASLCMYPRNKRQS